MQPVPYILAEASVLVVGVFLASALLPDGLQPVVGSILLLFHACSLILHPSLRLKRTAFAARSSAMDCTTTLTHLCVLHSEAISSGRVAHHQLLA